MRAGTRARVPASGLPVRVEPGFSAGRPLRRLCGLNRVQCDGDFGGSEGGSVLTSRPRPHCCKAFSQEGPRTPIPTLHSALPQTVLRPELEVLPPKKSRDGEAVGVGGGGGTRGCAAAALGSLITSACSAPALSSQLPSNTREFNSSINRREGLHFGERW